MSAITCLSVVGCSGHPMLKRTLKQLAKKRYVASVRDDQGTRIKLAGHLPYSPEHVGLFEQHDVRAALIYRDPRANFLQLVRRSLEDYCQGKFTQPGTHSTAVAYHRLVKDSEGRRGDQPFVEFYVDGIGGRDTLSAIFQVAEWRASPRVHAVRFEDLVNLYGDAPEAQRNTMRVIAAFVGTPVSEVEVDELVAACDAWLAKKVSTKQGYMIGWDEVFSEEDKAAFKRYFGPLLIDLGYEQDDNW